MAAPQEDLRLRAQQLSASRAAELQPSTEPGSRPEFLILAEERQVLVGKGIKRFRGGAAWSTFLHFVEHPTRVTTGDIEKAVEAAGLESDLNGALHLARVRTVFEADPRQPAIFVNTGATSGSRGGALYEMRAKARFVTKEEWEMAMPGSDKGQKKDDGGGETEKNGLGKKGDIFKDEQPFGLDSRAKLLMAYVLGTDIASEGYKARTGLLVTQEERDSFFDIADTIEDEEKGAVGLPKDPAELAELASDVGQMLDTIQINRNMAWRRFGNDEVLMELMKPFFDAQLDAPTKVPSLRGLWEEMVEGAVGIDAGVGVGDKEGKSDGESGSAGETSVPVHMDEEVTWAFGVSLHNLQMTNDLRELGIDLSEFGGIGKATGELIRSLREKAGIPDIEGLLPNAAEAVRVFAKTQDRDGFLRAQKLRPAREIFQPFTRTNEEVLMKLADKIEAIQF